MKPSLDGFALALAYKLPLGVAISIILGADRSTHGEVEYLGRPPFGDGNIVGVAQG